MERWSPDPLDGSTTCPTTCLYASVHVQTVDSLNYIFDVKLHQYFIACNTLTRKEPQRLHDQGIGGVSTWLKLVTHTLPLVIHLLGTSGICAWIYSSDTDFINGCFPKQSEKCQVISDTFRSIQISNCIPLIRTNPTPDEFHDLTTHRSFRLWKIWRA